MKYVIANWKMNGRQSFVQSWFKAVPCDFQSTAQVVIAPPLPYLSIVQEHLPAQFHMGAQDVSSFDTDGAHTGDVSAQMLIDAGCQYVIIGHSERREFGETDELLAKKLRNAEQAGLTPVFCVGESLEKRKAGDAWSFVESQLKLLQNYPADKPLIIAYEPIWAIGTGATATVEDVQEMHSQIKQAIDRPILYGGSVKSSNAQELMAIESVSGALVGGAALKPDEFLSIVEAAS